MNFLHIPEAPAIVEPLPTLPAMATGSSVELSCNASGNPLPYISWVFNDVNLTASSIANFNIISTSESRSIASSTLQIMSLSSSSSGEYKCVASNFITSVESATTLSLLAG